MRHQPGHFGANVGAMNQSSSTNRRSRWSWRIGSLSGVELRVHATFVMLLAWFAAGVWSEGPAAVLLRLAFIVALFACVVLHELGHALAARHYGIVTRDITVLPIGGLARLERMPEDSGQELWIAVAGPMVNVGLAAMLYGILAIASPAEGSAVWRLVGELALTNVALAVFNLLPAFPMDGGRVLRAALAVRRGRLRATRAAVAIGRGFAIIFGLLGLWANPVLVLIAVFLWFAASGELLTVELKAAAEHQLVADAMVSRFSAVHHRNSLAQALEELLAGTQEDFPVVDGRRILGMLYKPDLMGALASHGENSPVSAVMQESVTVLEAGARLEDALECIETAEGRSLPVAHHGRLVGLLTRQNLAELFAAREAVGHEIRRAPVA